MTHGKKLPGDPFEGIAGTVSRLHSKKFPDQLHMSALGMIEWELIHRCFLFLSPMSSAGALPQLGEGRASLVPRDPRLFFSFALSSDSGGFV